MSCGFLRETLCLLLRVHKQDPAHFSAARQVSSCWEAERAPSLCCHMSEQAASGLSRHSRSRWNTRAGISTQLPTILKDLKKPHSALRAPLQICCPGWVKEREGHYYQQATEVAEGQLPFDDLPCSESDKIRSILPVPPCLSRLPLIAC